MLWIWALTVINISSVRQLVLLLWFTLINEALRLRTTQTKYRHLDQAQCSYLQVVTLRYFANLYVIKCMNVMLLVFNHPQWLRSES